MTPFLVAALRLRVNRSVAGLAADVSGHCDTPSHVSLARILHKSLSPAIKKEWLAAVVERKQGQKIKVL
jgi:hypothetical protein